MSPSKLQSFLVQAFANNWPVLIKGAPGCGKTDSWDTAVDIYADEYESEADRLVIHPVISDPTDAKGLPGIVEGKADFLPFGDLRRMIEAKRPLFVLLDDLGQAPAVVQAGY